MDMTYSQTSLFRTRWNCLKTSRFPRTRDIDGKIVFKKLLGLTDHFDISIVFEITVLEISKFNYICISKFVDTVDKV